jgi:hypothetical protein
MWVFLYLTQRLNYYGKCKEQEPVLEYLVEHSVKNLDFEKYTAV